MSCDDHVMCVLTPLQIWEMLMVHLLRDLSASVLTVLYLQYLPKFELQIDIKRDEGEREREREKEREREREGEREPLTSHSLPPGLAE